MRIEIPECARCCACMPLRYGILIFGYLNLGFSILVVALEIYISVLYDSEYSVGEILTTSTIYMYRGVGLFSQMWFIMIIYGSEIVFNIILLVGAHMKRSSLLRAYYYYGVTTSLATLACYLLPGNGFNYQRPNALEYRIVEFCFAFAGFIVHVYLLLLIRSELKKLETKGQMCFVNHAAEVYVDPPTDEQGRNPL